MLGRVKSFLHKHGVTLLLVFMLAAVVGMMVNTNSHKRLVERQQSHTQSEQLRLIKLVTKTMSERDSLKKRVDSLESKKTDTSKNRQREAVVEKFDPTTGHLVERQISKSHDVTRTKTESIKSKQVKVSRETSRAVSDVTHTEKTQLSEIAKSHSIIEKPVTNVRLGAGILVTPAGVGPAVSYRLTDTGRVGLDAVVGLANGPKAGLQLSANITQSFKTGVGVYGQLNQIQGSNPQIVPGLTVQYRF